MRKLNSEEIVAVSGAGDETEVPPTVSLITAVALPEASAPEDVGGPVVGVAGLVLLA